MGGWFQKPLKITKSMGIQVPCIKCCSTMNTSHVAQPQRICLPTEQMWRRVRPLAGEDPLEKGVTAHSSILAWEVPWTEEPGGSSPWGCKESDMTDHTCSKNITGPLHPQGLLLEIQPTEPMDAKLVDTEG